MSRISLASRLGIRHRVILLAVMPVVLITLVLSVYLIGSRLSDERDALFERSQTLARYLAAGSEFAFFTGDTDTLATLARGLRKQTEINEVLFFSDQAGLLYSSSGGSGDSLPMDHHSNFLDQPYHSLAPGVWAFHVPVMVSELAIDDFNESPPNNTRIGWVVLVVNEAPLKAQQKTILQRGIFITLGGLLLTLLMARVIAQSITRPVQGVVDTVDRLRSGDLGARADTQSQGELGELEKGINSLAGRVQHNQMELQLEIRAATRELQRTLSRVETQNLALERARQDAEQANHAKDEFLARMSHELRTPLTSVLGFVGLLQRTPLNEEQLEYSAIIERASGLLLALIDDILDFSKLQSDAVMLEKIPFCLTACVEDILEMHSPLAREKGITLESANDGSLPVPLLGDPTRLRQIMTNLVNNAIKFTDIGTVRVQIKTHRKGSVIAVELEVRDSGMGIPADQQEQLFAPFVQADTSITRRFGGSGLGLVITRRLVELMGGQLALESRPGEGTRVTVRLSLEPATAAESSDHSFPNAVAQDKSHETRPAAVLDGLSILVAEDNDFNRLLLQRMLEQQGARITLAENGETALVLAQRHAFELIVMDIHMPIMDGIEASRRIRQLPGAEGRTPIIALTANVLAGEARELQRVGVACILHKPIDEQRLVSQIQLQVRGGKASLAEAEAKAPTPSCSPRLERYGISAQALHLELNAQIEALRQGLIDRSQAVMRDHSHQLMGLAGLVEMPELEAAVSGLHRALKETETRRVWRHLWRLQRVVAHLDLDKPEDGTQG